MERSLDDVVNVQDLILSQSRSLMLNEVLQFTLSMLYEIVPNSCHELTYLKGGKKNNENYFQLTKTFLLPSIILKKYICMLFLKYSDLNLSNSVYLFLSKALPSDSKTANAYMYLFMSKQY